MNGLDIAWAGGFLEGDGCFLFIKRKYGTEIRVEATQCDTWALQRLKKIFHNNGTISVKHIGPRNRRTPYRWRVNGVHALGVMQTVYCFLSPRQQIKIRTGLAALRAVGALAD